MMKNFDHIKQFEQMRVEFEEQLKQLNEKLDFLELQSENYRALVDYYYSDQRDDDLLADDQGEIDAPMVRGVLSEDELFYIMGAYNDSAIRMVEIAAKMLRQ